MAQTTTTEKKDIISKDFAKIFGSNIPTENELLANTKDIHIKINELAEKSEHLKRYHEIRKRMGKPEIKYVYSYQYIVSINSS